MKRKKSAGDASPASMEHISDAPSCQCHCDELAPAIEELTRQVHLLGVIIDELVSEFQWQNNQMAEQIRGASEFADRTKQESIEPRMVPSRLRRATLFE